jgi:hypothetical protein
VDWALPPMRKPHRSATLFQAGVRILKTVRHVFAMLFSCTLCEPATICKSTSVINGLPFVNLGFRYLGASSGVSDSPESALVASSWRRCGDTKPSSPDTPCTPTASQNILRQDGCNQPCNAALQQPHWLHQVQLVALRHDDCRLLAVPALTAITSNMMIIHDYDKCHARMLRK